jgi:hypothetical protein
MANGLGWSSAPSQSQDVVSAHEGRHMLIANDFTQYTLRRVGPVCIRRLDANLVCLRITSLPEKTFAAENPFLSRIGMLKRDVSETLTTERGFPSYPRRRC